MDDVSGQKLPAPLMKIIGQGLANEQHFSGRTHYTWGQLWEMVPGHLRIGRNELDVRADLISLGIIKEDGVNERRKKVYRDGPNLRKLTVNGFHPVQTAPRLAPYESGPIRLTDVDFALCTAALVAVFKAQANSTVPLPNPFKVIDLLGRHFMFCGHPDSVARSEEDLAFGRRRAGTEDMMRIAAVLDRCVSQELHTVTRGKGGGLYQWEPKGFQPDAAKEPEQPVAEEPKPAAPPAKPKPPPPPPPAPQPEPGSFLDRVQRSVPIVELHGHTQKRAARVLKLARLIGEVFVLKDVYEQLVGAGEDKVFPSEHTAYQFIMRHAKDGWLTRVHLANYGESYNDQYKIELDKMPIRLVMPK